jgi:hypothetical protein
VATTAPNPTRLPDPGVEPRPRVRARRYAPPFVVLAIGLLVTAILAWTCWTVNNRNETRLLHIQTQEGASIIAVALPGLVTPLSSALNLAEEAGGSPAKFSSYMAPYISNGSYTSVSLFELGPVPRRIDLVGQPPLEPATSPAVVNALAETVRTRLPDIIGPFGTPTRRVGYAIASPSGGYALYVERALPPVQLLKEASKSAFAGLNFALYIGKAPSTSHLLGADTAMLPLTGRTASVIIPFGASSILFLAAPTGELGGSLLGHLALIVAVVGVVLSLLGAWTVDRLARGRRRAEQLAAENRALYGQQRGIAQTLQRALLPEELPPVDGLEVGVRYRSGVEGVDVGGDWCDLVELGGSRVLLVVGDVSGRGLSAATTMASLHYSIRAYAKEGDSPSAILTKLSGLMYFESDSQFASVLCGMVDVDAHRLTLANAGHLPPLLVANGRRDFIDTVLGPPIGVENGRRYDEVTIDIPANSMVLAFTDGLVERRGEIIDVGMERLRAAVPSPPVSLDGCLDGLVDTMVPSGARDDTAILGLRWTK